MSDRRPYALLVLVALCSGGCATTKRKSQTPVGARHAPYEAKPEYLGTPALPDPSVLGPPMRQGMPVRATPLHVATPAEPATGEPATGEPAAEGETQEATPAEEAPPEPSGSLTVAPSNEGPALNRVQEQQPLWIPQPINIPNGPHP